MTDKAQDRPPQVTLLGGAILVGSVFMVALVFDRMSSLGSIEAQEEAQRFVNAGLGQGLGVDADQWQSVLRVMCLVAGAAGVVTAYLGWQVLQRDRSARLVLSLFIPVLLVAGVPTTDYIATTLVVAVVLLWRQPARDWLDGKAVPVAPRTPARTDRTPPPQEASHAMNAPDDPYAPKPVPSSSGAPAYPAPSGPAPVYSGSGPAYGGASEQPPRRPGTVLAAVITTIISSVIVLLASLSTVLLIIVGRETFEDDLQEQMDSQSAYREVGLAVGTVTDVLVVLLVVFTVWAAIAIVLAVLTARGVNGARIALVVSSIVAALASLVASLAIVPLVITAASIAVAVLLLRGDASGWFAARRSARSAR